MIEILATLQTKDNYSKYSDIVAKHTTDTDILKILTIIPRYYADTELDSISWTRFSTYFFVKNPMITGARKVLFESMFTQLAVASATAVTDALIDHMLQQYHAERIAFMALEVAEGKRDELQDIQVELDMYLDNSGKSLAIGAEANREDLTTLLASLSPGSGLTWRLDALNQSLGAIRKGNFILFGGRPDSGKTTLLCSEVTHMASQLRSEEQVLYFTNEEGARAVKPRLICSLLGVTLTELRKNPGFYWDSYKAALGGDEDKILVIDKADLSINDIEWWLKHEKPGLIAIDQLRKVRGFAKDAGVTRLEKLFNYARELSKEYAPVLTVTQLDGNAQDVQYPSMAALYESKTAVQGEMDAIVNIGQLTGSIPPNARYLNIVKNKLPTPLDESMRKAQYEVLLRGDIARFT